MEENAQEVKIVKKAYGETAQESPIVVRTRFNNQFVNIQDLQSQLYRDASRCDVFQTKEYIQELVERLNNLKR